MIIKLKRKKGKVIAKVKTFKITSQRLRRLKAEAKRK